MKVEDLAEGVRPVPAGEDKGTITFDVDTVRRRSRCTSWRSKDLDAALREALFGSGKTFWLVTDVRPDVIATERRAGTGRRLKAVAGAKGESGPDRSAQSVEVSTGEVSIPLAEPGPEAQDELKALLKDAFERRPDGGEGHAARSRSTGGDKPERQVQAEGARACGCSRRWKRSRGSEGRF